MAAFAQLAASSLQPGEYVAEGGMGHLTLRPARGGALAFSIESMGGNGHMCSLEGELRNGRAVLEGLEEKLPCIVTMALTPQGVDVKGGPGGACLLHCGARATFEMVYFKPAPACAVKAVAATRKAFLQHYTAKQFDQARALLESVLKECARALDWLEIGRIRNDLAVTLHKLGEMAACRAVLQPLAEDASLTDAGIRENYPPTDADLYLPIVRATRTNLKLCS
ncbi:MAG: hypothetical protein CFE44_12325 [Burkholderiales bacterium PBB4]|nr:MAG: hypothetical protein CFE44_12325 [Burkholderiales bacterium PBB4]